MARKNKYTEAEVEYLVDEYFLRLGENKTPTDEFNAWAIGNYWKENGYPDMNGQYLNRRKGSRDRIEELKEELRKRTVTGIFVDEQNIVKSFDYTVFWENNKNQRFCGLEKIGNAIDAMRKQNQELRKSNKQLNDDLNNFKKENETLKNSLEKRKEENKKMEERLTKAEDAAARIVELVTKSLSEVIPYEDAERKGEDVELGDFLKNHTFHGEEGKKTLPMKEIENRFSINTKQNEKEDLRGKDALNKRLLK